MAFVAKEVFDNLVEEFRGLQVQVMDQDKTIKKLTDGLTLSEGALKEKLETRLTDAVREMNLRVEEVKIEIKKMEEKSEQLLEATVPGLIQTHMNDAKSQCRQFISENNKSLADRLDKVDKFQNTIAEFENTIAETKEHFEQIKDIKNIKDQVNKEIQSIKENMVQLTAKAQSSPPGLGQTPTVHIGQQGEDKSVS